MDIPDQLLYSKDHFWIARAGVDTVRIGFTDFAQDQFGEITFLEIERIGETLSKDDVFGTVEAVKAVSDLFMPLSGEITEVNPLLSQEPSRINKDPYGEGWVALLRVADPRQMDALLSSESYRELIG